MTLINVILVDRENINMTDLEKDYDLFEEVVHKNNKFKRQNRHRRIFWILVLILFGYLLYAFFFNQTDPLSLDDIWHFGIEPADSLF